MIDGRRYYYYCCCRWVPITYTHVETTYLKMKPFVPIRPTTTSYVCTLSVWLVAETNGTAFSSGLLFLPYFVLRIIYICPRILFVVQRHKHDRYIYRYYSRREHGQGQRRHSRPSAPPSVVLTSHPKKRWSRKKYIYMWWMWRWQRDDVFINL